MNCPLCGNEKSQVIDTRRYDTVVLRVRRCSSCLIVFHTSEEICPPYVVKTSENQPDSPQITK